MMQRIAGKQTQIHPSKLEMKRWWNKIVAKYDLKKSWLACRCDVDNSSITHWLDTDTADFPNWDHMVTFIEALQEGMGVEPWEPVDAFARYFGCIAFASRGGKNRPIQTLAALVALQCGKVTSYLLQAQSNDSEDGTGISITEREELKVLVGQMRRFCDDLDDSLQETKARTA